MPDWFFMLSLGLFGLVFGSFANVVIWRVPRRESISTPASHCPRCDTPILWFDNVPVVSWLVLRARCRHCGEPISARYPAVELLSGALFVAAAAAFGVGARAVFAAVLFWFLLVLSAIDIDTFRLPNPLVGGLAIVGVLGIVIGQVTGIEALPLVSLVSDGWLSHPIASSSVGVLLGGGITIVIAGLYYWLRGKSGLGMGDIKLLVVLGLFLGPYVLLALFFGSLAGAIGGAAQARGERFAERRIPFGPWLSLGAVAASLWGPVLVRWYLTFVGVS